MRILIIARCYPAPDRNAGDLRLQNLLPLLCEEAEVHFCATALAWQRSQLGAEAVRRYERALDDGKVRILRETVPEILRARSYDCVVFEFHDVAVRYIDFVRCLQPRCKVVIDTVDLHFERLRRAAEVSGRAEDAEAARAVREAELATYARADLLIAVTQDEATKLSALLDVAVVVLAGINAARPFVDKASETSRRLLFVGGFTHAPNEDGIVDFCTRTFPIIRDRHPDVRLQIVGNAPTDRVRSLAGPGVEVVGYVPGIAPYLERNGISIAPLRFGAGLKGKVGEAMSHGLAVVSTSIGVEGFGLTPGEHAYVADDPDAFAAAVIRLIEDASEFERVRKAGWAFFDARFGDASVRAQVESTIAKIEAVAPQSQSVSAGLGTRFRLWRFHLGVLLHRHLLWRFDPA